VEHGVGHEAILDQRPPVRHSRHQPLIACACLHGPLSDGAVRRGLREDAATGGRVSMSAGGPAPGEMTAAVPAGICGSIRRRMPATSPLSVTSARAAAIRDCSHAERVRPEVAQRTSISARSSSVTLAQTVFRFPSGLGFRGTTPVYRYVSAASSGILLRMEAIMGTIPDCTCSRPARGGDHDRDCALNVWTRSGLPSCGLCGAARPCPGGCDK
jgi:hypothetical protein